MISCFLWWYKCFIPPVWTQSSHTLQNLFPIEKYLRFKSDEKKASLLKIMGRLYAEIILIMEFNDIGAATDLLLEKS